MLQLTDPHIGNIQSIDSRLLFPVSDIRGDLMAILTRNYARKIDGNIPADMLLKGQKTKDVLHGHVIVQARHDLLIHLP
jgi:hypothetical protein